MHVAYQAPRRSADGTKVAIAVARQRTNKTLRLAQPAVRPTSRIELTGVLALALAAAGVWLFVIPLELVALVTG
jgi:hypothetical protein